MLRHMIKCICMYVCLCIYSLSVHQWPRTPIILKTQKIVLDASCFNTQHYKVRIKDKWHNPGKGVASPLHLSVVAIEKGAFGSPLIYLFIYIGLYMSMVEVYKCED